MNPMFSYCWHFPFNNFFKAICFYKVNIIIQFKVDKLKTKLKWEISRDNDLFPHYYGHIETDLAEKVFNLDLGPNGVHEFPKNFFS